MEKVKNIAKLMLNKPIKSVLLMSVASSVMLFLIFFISSVGKNGAVVSFLAAPAMALFIVLPALLSIYNIIYLVLYRQSAETQRAGRRVELFSIIYGGLCAFLWYGINSDKVLVMSDWYVQLYNSEIHAPIYTEALPTVAVLAVIALVSYIILRVKCMDGITPLLATLCIGGIYIGIALAAVLGVQLLKHDVFMPLYLLNIIFIFVKVIKEVVLDYTNAPKKDLSGKSTFVVKLYGVLSNSVNWAWLGLLAALPLLGIVVAVLSLLGQAPDSIVKAWTETADWTFSQKIPPQNIQEDMHYLCTVAAGGHRNFVKPIRVGKRHGHRILVNRQLLVANAFEELIQERAPRFHRIVRHIYDKYGYPIAKHIKSPFTADVVWLIMKPAEWLFVAVLYLFDKDPETRIAVQYPHTSLSEFKNKL